MISGFGSGKRGNGGRDWRSNVGSVIARGFNFGIGFGSGSVGLGISGVAVIGSGGIVGCNVGCRVGDIVGCLHGIFVVGTAQAGGFGDVNFGGFGGFGGGTTGSGGSLDSFGSGLEGISDSRSKAGIGLSGGIFIVGTA